VADRAGRARARQGREAAQPLTIAARGSLVFGLVRETASTAANARARVVQAITQQDIEDLNAEQPVALAIELADAGRRTRQHSVTMRPSMTLDRAEACGFDLALATGPPLAPLVRLQNGERLRGHMFDLPAEASPACNKTMVP
jgi:hypothetical protein